MKINKIYLIDDDPVFAQKFVNDMMKYTNYVIQHFSSVEVGLQYAEIDNPDIVFLDHQMPGENGVDSIPKWQKINPKVRIIIVSNNKDASVLKKAMEFGVTEYINKDVYLLGDAHRILHDIKGESAVSNLIKRLTP